MSSKVNAILIAATLSLASCSVGPGKGMVTGTVTPASLIDAHISPAVISVGVTTATLCPTFATPFDLVIVPTAESRAFLDSVTLRLVDGSSVGGPAVTFPQPALTHIFGSTLIVGSRTFSFLPQFDCGFVPRALQADIVIVDDKGVERQMTATATVK